MPCRVGKQQQRGTAVVITLAILGALLVGGLLAVGLSQIALRTSGQSLAAKRAFYCAEAGLAAGRDFFRPRVALWDGYFASGFVFVGQAALASSGLPFAVSISDNRDELPPQINDPLHDRDYTVLLRSTCTDPVLQTQVALQQQLTLNPIGASGGLPVQAGPYAYTTTADFTAGVGTDAAGNPAMMTATISATAVDLRGDQMVLQPAQMTGRFTVRRYCGESCNGWKSAAWVALSPAGTLVTVRARSAPMLAGLGAATWVPLMSGVSAPQLGPGSLRGRFVEVEVTLQSAIAGVTPSVDSLTVTPY